MAFFQLVLKARNLERARLRYEDEKLRSIENAKGARPHLTLKQQFRRKRLKYRKQIKHLWNRIISPIKCTWIYKKVTLLRTDGSLENYILKSAVGFLGGILLTYLFFVFFVFQLNFTLSSATILCSFLGVILTLGLAFSYRVRCIVFLLLPQFFSKRGRQALMAYAFILTITGPGKNTLHNTSVLSESLVCGQDQLKQAVKNVIDIIKQPFYALRDAISKVIKSVKMVVKKIKRTLMAIKRLVLSILKVITSVFEWLGSIVNICNKKLGTPFDRCQTVFEGAVADCQAKLGPLFGGICNLTYIAGALCYIVKPLDFICMLVSYVADTIVDSARRKIKRFTLHVKAMFYVKVKFSHSFHFETNQTKTIEDVSTNIINEIRARTDRFLTVFDWMSFMTTFFIFFMLLRIMHYRHKWLTSERFDNQYLTNDLRTIDLIRSRQEKETILPLSAREKNRYIPLTSVTLVKVERVKLAKSAVFLSLTTFKICIHMMADYSLYWILSIIRNHGQIETRVQKSNFVGVHVSGDGYLADLYRSIVKAFTPSAKYTEIDTTPCLPDPIPPNFDRYTQIMTLILFCWIMAIFEPYGLRLRHVVMCKYHPERAKQRAAWLYNHIIRSRGSFLKFARRQLRRKFAMAEGEKVERVTFKERCLAICPFLNKFFLQQQITCLLCGAIERSDSDSHVKCATPGCVGLFCIQCFADLQNLCTICRSPIEYGDLSDMSEERDSSDDQLIVKRESVPVPKEELIVEEEFKGKIKAKETSEGKPEIEEQQKEKDFIIITEKKDEAVQTDNDIDSSSESMYSYTYQDESSREIETDYFKTPFKDVEAQKIREDVTIQIFNDSFAKEVTSSSEDPTSCFVVRARKRLRTKLKRKSCSCPRKDDSSSSTSIAKTESWPTEDVDEEEVVHIEVDDGSQKLLLTDGAVKEKKRSNIRRIVSALTKISWFGNNLNDGDVDKKWRTKKPSFLGKITQMLRGKQFGTSVRSYRRIRTTTNTKKDMKCKDSTTTSSSSAEEAEQNPLLKTHDWQVDCLQITDHDGSEDNIYSRNYDSHRARRRMICCHEDHHVKSDDDVNLKYPHEKQFATKQLPRYLHPVSKDTAYFEVDETKDLQSIRKCVCLDDPINVLSDTKISTDSQRTERWNITSDDRSQHSYEGAYEENKSSQSDTNNTVIEQNDEVFKTDEMSETDRELLITDCEFRSDGEENKGEIITIEDTSTDTKTDGLVNSKKVAIMDDQRKLFKDNGRTIGELRRTTKGKDLRKYPVHKEKSKEMKLEDKGEPVILANDKFQLYDPIAGLELYDDMHLTKRYVEKNIAKPNYKLDIKKTYTNNEFEEGIGNWHHDMHIHSHKIKKSTKMLQKSTQTDFQKSRSPKKHTTSIDVKISNVDNLEEKKSKNQRIRGKKRPDKRVHRNKRTPWRPDEIGKQKGICFASSPIKFTGLCKNRQTQCNFYVKKKVQGRQNSVLCLKSINEPEVQSCNFQSQTCEPIINSANYTYPDKQKWGNELVIPHPHHRCIRATKFACPDEILQVPTPTRLCLSQHKKISLSENQSRQMERRRYNVDVRENKLEIPMLKKYLPSYQAPGLIDELKENDRMRLIQEREARRWTALSALRGTKCSSVSSESRNPSQNTFDICNTRDSLSKLTSVEENNTLPYQETQSFKDVVCELRKRIMEAPGRHLISLSQRADKCKDLKQLFPPKNEDRIEVMTMSKFDKVVNRLKPTCNKGENECSIIHKEKQRFPKELFSETSSICSYSCKNRRSDISTSADETTDNN